jgi:hypothetical protein
MNLDHAPRFFWAALSLSLVLLTGGLLLMAYRASSVSVEFADAKLNFANDKITVAGIVSDTKAQIESLQRQNQELETAKTNLEAQLAHLSLTAAATNSAMVLRPEIAEVSKNLSNVSRTLPPQNKLATDIGRLETIQKRLTKVSAE